MTAKEILADLRADFGPQRVLYAEDMAKILGKTKKGTDALRNSGGFPVEPKPVGGRPAVSIYDVAAWLAGTYQPNKPTKTQLEKATEKPAAASTPARRRKSLGKALLALKTQHAFIGELFMELEAISIADDLKQGESKGNYRKVRA